MCIFKSVNSGKNSVKTSLESGICVVFEVVFYYYSHTISSKTLKTNFTHVPLMPQWEPGSIPVATGLKAAFVKVSFPLSVCVQVFLRHGEHTNTANIFIMPRMKQCVCFQ